MLGQQIDSTIYAYIASIVCAVPQLQHSPPVSATPSYWAQSTPDREDRISTVTNGAGIARNSRGHSMPTLIPQPTLPLPPPLEKEDKREEDRQNEEKQGRGSPAHD